MSAEILSFVRNFLYYMTRKFISHVRLKKTKFHVTCHKMKNQVLNNQELATHRKIFDTYCLIPEDFESELEYNRFLELRENVVFAAVQKKPIPKADDQFQKDYSKQIAARKAEILNSRDVLKTWKVLPLLSQMEQEKRKKTTRRQQAFQVNLDYKSSAFVNEANNRDKLWQPDQQAPRFQICGDDPAWYMQKAKEELLSSLTRPH